MPAVCMRKQNDLAFMQAMCDMSAADWELCGMLEERQCGAPAKMAAPTMFANPIVIIESDEEGREDHVFELVQDECNASGTSAIQMPVEVRAPSGHWSKVRAGFRVTCSTWGEPIDPVVEPDDDDDNANDGEQQSMSWGTAGIAGLPGLKKEILDYDEEGFLEEGEIVEEEDSALLVKTKASRVGGLI
ncbi:hypothetical protein NDU88_008278 [Pleurodeles waltl]|uniref:Uncharacterized protein n=1 Tax=Pleurodeles waltl TaxID=8319 RepID=A0AAV7VUP5_PLEWA|nr:hypothetical protein NDU88_008278 [Pleurodeles waltl]